MTAEERRLFAREPWKIYDFNSNPARATNLTQRFWIVWHEKREQQRAHVKKAAEEKRNRKKEKAQEETENVYESKKEADETE